MKRHLLVIGIIFLFLISSVAPSINANIENINSYIKKSSEKITVYYCDASFEFEKESWTQFSGHYHYHAWTSFLHIDADLEELIIEVVMNYTAVMNYNLRLPYPLAPILAFGLKVENYTDYVWETFKLKHNGYMKQEGNISVVINIDMDQFGSGDIECLQPYTVTIGENKLRDINLKTPNNESSYYILLRILYNTPILNKLLLHNWLLPLLAPYNHHIGSVIWLYFDG